MTDEYDKISSPVGDPYAGFSSPSAAPEVNEFGHIQPVAKTQAEQPSFWERASYGIHKGTTGLEALEPYLNPFETLEEKAIPSYGKWREGRRQKNIAENKQTQAAMERGRGITAESPWYKKIDPVELGGEVIATAPASAITGPGAGVVKAVTTGALQGAVQGGVIGASEGKPVEGAVAGGIGGGTFGGALHLGGAGLIKYFADKLPDSLKNAAVQKILERISLDQKAGGVTAQDSLDAINAAHAAGKPMTLADTGGANVQGLAGYVSRRPGESREIASNFLDARDAAAPDRLNADVAQHINGGESMHHTTQALLEARSAAARPAYEAAMDPARVVDSPLVRDIINDPTVRAGMNKGIESQRLEALAAGQKFDPKVYVAEPTTVKSPVVDASGKAFTSDADKKVGLPNMRLLDAAKRGLDAEIEGERNDFGRLSQRGLMLSRVRSKLVSELDRLNPEYAAARASWSGPSASMDAMKMGQNIFSKKPEEIAAEFAELPESDKEFYRVGVADKIKEKIGKTGFGGDEAKAILKNEWMKGQLKPIFRTEADFNKFVDSVDAERKMFETRRNVLGGSQTAARQAEDQGSGVPELMHGVGAALKLKTGNLLGAARDYMQMRRLHGLAENPELNAEIARHLFDPNLRSLSVPGVDVPLLGDASRVPALAASGASAATSVAAPGFVQASQSPEPVQ